MPERGQLEERLRIIVEALSGLTPEERLFIHDGITDAYCPHCGDEQPTTGSCQCWNDE